MRVDRIRQLTLSVVLLFAALFSVDVSAQSQSQSRRRDGLFGDWRVKMDFNGREWESILAFSRGREGKRTGQWISLWGVSDLKDVSFEDGKLSFAHSRQGRDGQTITSKFTGTVKRRNLTGTLSSERGEVSVTGTRSRYVPRAVGNWETKFTIGDRAITNKLVVTADEKGKVAVDWQSDRVKHKISAVSFKQGKLTFKTDSKMDDRQWQSTFEGTFQRGKYSGVIKSDRGETPVEGKLLGAPLIGTWNLDVSSDRGDRKQRFRVFPDMSGLFGATPIKKVQLEDGEVSFKISLEFGDQTYDLEFKGKLHEGSLTGEITTSRGTSKVTGKKVQRRGRRNRRTN
ncbi:MAG: hypothetical protein O7J95_21535 [Planctomycetota bacterium]|nr:hypothetical protein [Planctomycetota bacterium]